MGSKILYLCILAGIFSSVPARCFAWQSNLKGTAIAFTPATVQHGSALQISSTIVNNGGDATGATIQINFFLSPNASNPFWRYLDSVYIDALDAGETRNVSITWTVPTDLELGDYYVWVSVDPHKVIAESDENDNIDHAATLVQVIAPRETILRPGSVSGAVSGKAGTVLSFSSGSATSSFGHILHYQFNWGDGDYSSWGSREQSHSYTSAGLKNVSSRARCAIHTDIISSWSPGWAITITAPPAAPTNLQATAGIERVSLTWDANSESDFLRYRIYGGTQPSPTTVIDSVADIAQTQVTLLNMTPPSVYYFRITAVNTAMQESAFSNQSSATPSAASLTPPTNLRATPSSGRITLKWNASIGSDFFRYNIYSGPLPEPTNLVDYEHRQNRTEWTMDVSDFLGDVLYFRMTAMANPFEESAYSNEVSVRPFPKPPLAPKNLKAVPGLEQITLTWDANKEPAFLRYNIYAEDSPSPTNFVAATNDINDTTWTLSGLDPAERYYFKVTAVDSFLQESENSEVVSAYPNSPDLHPDSPTGLDAIAGNQMIKLRWDANTENDILRYRIYSSPANTIIDSVDAMPAPEKVLMNLINGIYYEFRVTAVDTGLLESGFSGAAIAKPGTMTSPTIAFFYVAALHAKDLAIEIKRVSGNYIDEANLHFRRGGDINFTQIPMLRYRDNYDYEWVWGATVPAGKVSERGIEYYITFTDGVVQPISEPPSGFFSDPVFLPDSGLAFPAMQPSGSAQNAFRLISLPIDADTKSPQEILTPILGEYDQTVWRFFEAGGGTSKTEFPNTSDMEPGKAFWLIVGTPGKKLVTGSGKTVSTQVPFEISLKPGWNTIGNPFAFQIPAANLSISDGQPVVLRRYLNEWNDNATAPVRFFQPFIGYAVFNRAGDDVVLQINPDLASGNSSTVKTMSRHSPAGQWGIRIDAACQDAKDRDTHLIFRPDAASGFDIFDQAEPPGVGEYVSVSFSHPDWDVGTKSFSVDARPAPVNGDIVDFEVATTIDDVVQLVFLEQGDILENIQIILIDPVLGYTQDLRKQNKYKVSALPGHAKKLQLLVGDNEFVEQQVQKIASIPEDIHLFQNYPNPFNPSTMLRFALPERGEVVLDVFDASGKKTANLYQNAMLDAGFHETLWRAGRAASGVYFARLTVIPEKGGGVFSTSIKLILLR